MPGTSSVAHGWSASKDGRNHKRRQAVVAERVLCPVRQRHGEHVAVDEQQHEHREGVDQHARQPDAVVDGPAAPLRRDRAEGHAEHEPGDRHDAEQLERVRRRRGDDVGDLPTAQVGAEVTVGVVRQAVDERAEARVARLVVAGVVQSVARLDGGQLRGARDAVAEERQRRVAVELDGERGQQVQDEHHEEQREHGLQTPPRDVAAHQLPPAGRRSPDRTSTIRPAQSGLPANTSIKRRRSPPPGAAWWRR